MSMRRKDREVTDIDVIRDVIGRCFCCRIGFNDNGEVYIVPLSFGFEERDGSFVFYFHGAKEGRKIDLIGRSPDVGFEMDTDYRLNEGNSACSYSARFMSIIGNGTVGMVESEEEKRHGLSLIMKHCTGKDGWIFDDGMVDTVAVFKLVVTRLSCKQHH